MGYEDNKTKVFGFARAGIREAEASVYLIGKKLEEAQPNLIKARSKLAAEEQKVADLEAEQFEWAQKKVTLTELVEQLRVRKDSLPDMTDEEFEERQADLRWRVADLTGVYTFIGK